MSQSSDQFDRLLSDALARLQKDQAELRPAIDEALASRVKTFLQDPDVSQAAKGLYVLLTQDIRPDHALVPAEHVRVRDAYDHAVPFAQYELDFAIYAGSRSQPVKIALECALSDKRSELRISTDRRKDIDLQSSGWIVLRFEPPEITAELQRLAAGEPAYRIPEVVENIILTVGNQIDSTTSFWPEVRSALTGYTWDRKSCPSCGHWQYDTLEIVTTCRHCGAAIPPSDK